MNNVKLEQLWQQVHEAQCSWELAIKEVTAARMREYAARKTLRRLGADLAAAQQQQYESRHMGDRPRQVARACSPASRGKSVPAHGERPPAPGSRRHSAVWKTSSIEVDNAHRHPVVEDETPRAPLARLSHDDAHDLWNN